MKVIRWFWDGLASPKLTKFLQIFVGISAGILFLLVILIFILGVRA